MLSPRRLEQLRQAQAHRRVRLHKKLSQDFGEQAAKERVALVQSFERLVYRHADRKVPWDWFMSRRDFVGSLTQFLLAFFTAHSINHVGNQEDFFYRSLVAAREMYAQDDEVRANCLAHEILRCIEGESAFAQHFRLTLQELIADCGEPIDNHHDSFLRHAKRHEDLIQQWLREGSPYGAATAMLKLHKLHRSNSGLVKEASLFTAWELLDAAERILDFAPKNARQRLVLKYLVKMCWFQFFTFSIDNLRRGKKCLAELWDLAGRIDTPEYWFAVHRDQAAYLRKLANEAGRNHAALLNAAEEALAESWKHFHKLALQPVELLQGLRRVEIDLYRKTDKKEEAEITLGEFLKSWQQNPYLDRHRFISDLERKLPLAIPVRPVILGGTLAELFAGESLDWF